MLNGNRQEITVTLLGRRDEVSFAAGFEYLSSRTLQLCTRRPLAWGSLLKVQCGETLWIGEACYCRREDTNRNAYRTWVKLVEAVCESELPSRVAA